jgi:hypothetical protein
MYSTYSFNAYLFSLLEKHLFAPVLNPISTGSRTGIVHPVLMEGAHLYWVFYSVLM